MSVVLQARELTAGYGTAPVVERLDLEVHAGEVVLLLGANGAGKTTTLLALSGELPLLRGSVEFLGDSAPQPLHRKAARGLGFVTEERSVFAGLTLADNLRVGRCDEGAALALFPELRQRLDVRGGLLSGGEQQMLSLARALSRNPRVLLADELSLGLAPMIVLRLLQAVRAAAHEHGTGVLIVEQHVRTALRFADRVYVMRRGRVQMTMTAAEALDRVGEIEQQYLSDSSVTTTK